MADEKRTREMPLRIAEIIWPDPDTEDSRLALRQAARLLAGAARRRGLRRT